MIREEVCGSVDKQRKPGRLHFVSSGQDDCLEVYWKHRSGELAQGKTWTASVSFARDFTVSERAHKLVFGAISSPGISIKLQTDTGVILDCVVHDIFELADCGEIDVASPDLGGVKMTSRYET